MLEKIYLLPEKIMIWIAYLISEKENTPVKLEQSHQENIYKTIVSIALEITPKVYKSNFKNMVLIEISEVIRLKKGCLIS